MGDVFKVVKLVDAPVVISGNVTLTGGVAVAASGNTAGTMATVSNGTAILAGGNNVTLSQSNNTISIIAGGGTGGGGGVAISAGTNSTSTGTVVFANSNGVSFGMNTNGVVTGTVQTNYLTTAMASDAGSNFVATSNSSLFQHTSATSAITSNAMNTSERDNYFYTSNNTFANNTHTHGNIAFSGTNVSGSFTSASDGISIQLSGGAGAAGNTGYLSAGTTNASLGTISLQNGSGVSWGINGQTLTASVKTDYLTTAAVSDHSHGNPTLALTNLTGTTASNSGGFTLSLSAGAAGAADGINALVVNAGASTQSTTLTLSNSNNVSFGLNAGVITASASFNQTVQPAVAQLNGSSGTMSVAVGSSLSASSNASTITFGLASNITTALQSAGAYLTTAALSNHTHGNPSITGSISITSNSNAWSISIPAFLTTAAQSNQVVNSVNGSTGQISLATGSSLSSSQNGSTITFGLASNITTALQSAGAYLTTAAQSNHSHGNPTLALTNLSGTTNSASNGLTISLSAAAPGAGGGVVVGNTATTFTSGTVIFRGTNLTVNTSAGQFIDLSVAAPGAAAENNNINLLGANTAGNTTASGSTIGWSGLNLTLSGTNNSQVVISAPATSSLVGAGGISLSSNGSTITVSYTGAAGGGVTWNYFNPQDGYVQVAGQQGNASMHIQPVRAPNVTFDRLAIPLVVSNSTNSSGTVTVSIGMDIYTRNVSTLSHLMSTSGSFAVTFSGSVNNSTYAGMRLLTIPWSSSLSEEQYYVGIWSRTTTGGGNCTVNQMLCSQVNSVFSGLFGGNSNATIQYTRGLGHYSATFSTALPSSVPISQILGSASIVLRQPVFYFVNGTI